MNRFYNTLAALAVVLTPVAMMAIAGWEAYAATLARTGIAWLAVVAGVATAATLECIGILAGETTLHFHGRADRRWLLAAAVLLAYVIAGLYVLRGTVLVFLPVLAGAVYMLVGLRAQAQREAVSAAEQAQDNRDWEREQWRIRQSDRTRLKLVEVGVLAQSQHAAESEAREREREQQVLALSQQVAELSGAPVAPSEHPCNVCGRTFATVQALNAHRRHCAGAVLAVPLAERSNGHREAHHVG